LYEVARNLLQDGDDGVAVAGDAAGEKPSAVNAR
jgi:hypothetical protein